MRAILSRLRTDCAVILLAILTMLTWPGEIVGLVCDFVGLP